MSLPPLIMLAEGRKPRPRKAANSEIRPRDRNAEARIHAATIKWIQTVAPEVIAFHVPNGGLRTKAEASRMKWLGVLAGVPDIVVISRDGQSYFVEVKAEGGALSAEQRAMQNRCTALRVPYVVVRSIDDIRLAFSLWGIPTREAVPA